MDEHYHERNVQIAGVHAVMGTPQHLLSCLEVEAWPLQLELLLQLAKLGSPGALENTRILRFTSASSNIQKHAFITEVGARLSLKISFNQIFSS